MKKFLTLKLILLISFIYIFPFSQTASAQSKDIFEMDEEDWPDDSFNEPSEEVVPPKPESGKSQPPKTSAAETKTKPAAATSPVKSAASPVGQATPPKQERPSIITTQVVSKPKVTFDIISQAQPKYTVSGVVKRAGPPLVLISRPTYAPYSTETNTMYISAVAEAFFHFKIGALMGIQVVPFERTANTIQYFRDFSRRISRTAYIEAAKKLGAAYLIYQEYEPQGKKVKFSVDLYSVTDNKKISGKIDEFNLSDFENGLNNFTNEIAAALVGTLPTQTTEILKTPVLGNNQRQIEMLGQAIVNEGGYSSKQAEKVLSEFEKLSKEKTMHLARFIGAQVMARAHQFEKAISFQQQLTSAFGEKYPALFLQLAEYYRKNGAYNDALSAAAGAERDPYLKLLVQIEKARIYEAEGRLEQARQEYESALSAGGEDGEIYFQLALVSIGLNNLSQAERYLEKAAAAGRSLDPGDYFDLGVRYEALGTANEQAINAYRNCLSLQQDNVEAWQKLANLYSASGREPEAAECYVNLFKINNKLYKDYLVKAGIMFENNGYLENAKEIYSLFLDRRFENPEVSVRLARLEMQSGNCKKAIELVDNMDTLGEFGPEIIAINTQCGKQQRLVTVSTTAHDKGWRRVFFWRVGSAGASIAFIAGGVVLNKFANDIYNNKYKPARRVEDVNKYHNLIATMERSRNLCYIGAGLSITSLTLSITLPIVFSKN